jgi:NAD(P)H-dependent flavin oxidoreductase YrpB (nitropropane dioxygenase family)
MMTPICERLGCEVPIFAFSHCRDVIAAVTNAGGYACLGASTVSPEDLEVEMRWIDEHTNGRSYGVDVIIPTAYDKEAEAAPEELERMIPEEHRGFMDTILQEEGVPDLPDEDRAQLRKELAAGRGGMTPDGARRLLRVALEHPQVNMIVSALGTPPPDVVEELRQRDLVIGAMCGKVAHAKRQLEAGVEVIIAQGTEAGGHTGEISTLVLVPQVVEAAGDRAAVLAAGGIYHGSQIAAALAMGAQGVWCGTIWLGTRESELDAFQKECIFETPTEGTIRSKVRTGKTVRMRRSKLSEAWARPEAPAYLPTPLQGVLYNEAHQRVIRARRKDLYSFPVGQSVGAVTSETSVRDIMYNFQLEYGEAMERLAKFMM